MLASGYETTATPQSFYTSVFTTAKSAPGVKKTKAGFELKDGRRGKAGKRKAAGKKRGRKKAGRRKRTGKK